MAVGRRLIGVVQGYSEPTIDQVLDPAQVAPLLSLQSLEMRHGKSWLIFVEDAAPRRHCRSPCCECGQKENERTSNPPNLEYLQRINIQDSGR